MIPFYRKGLHLSLLLDFTGQRTAFRYFALIFSSMNFHFFLSWKLFLSSMKVVWFIERNFFYAGSFFECRKPLWMQEASFNKSSGQAFTFIASKILFCTIQDTKREKNLAHFKWFIDFPCAFSTEGFYPRPKCFNVWVNKWIVTM